ncbi:MAG: phosphoribosylformylglycinamidine synthase [Pseudomonadota bacterium]|nr:phosphoribosylformylglycinamidine synthase [Pseudomonadota bacterium]
MISFHSGIQALRKFKVKSLNERIQSLIPDINLIGTEYIHFIESDLELSPSNKKILDKLLNYTPKVDLKKSKNIITISPRIGTISPWSSKASDICQLCGLSIISRLERGINYHFDRKTSAKELDIILELVMDKMTESRLQNINDSSLLFNELKPSKFNSIDILNHGQSEITRANLELGLALSDSEVNYLFDSFIAIKRNPRDIELMMFAQANSEHCRHKIFNADWTIDSEKQAISLFGMIKNTYEQNPKGLLSVYSDNSAVTNGYESSYFEADEKGIYRSSIAEKAILMKVETHNHPTAIAPNPGAATGSGGEIRDEGATGRGSKPKAGLCGFSVSNLKIPNSPQPWERENGKPSQIASALEIMIDAPIGAASFNNEFGRPNTCGYFRTYEQRTKNNEVRGYHKPIMLAGGIGNIKTTHVEKGLISDGDKIIVLGGPAMLIGLGGGAASSIGSGDQNEDLDFASVQRANAEMQRRAQEVINACVNLGDKNPIVSIHDIGAGGLSNGIPELVNDSKKGAQLQLRSIPNDELKMSPLEIWCNESQERYVIAIKEESINLFDEICSKERAPYAVLGSATEDRHLLLEDSYFNNCPIDIEMSLLFGSSPKTHKDVKSLPNIENEFEPSNINIVDAISRLLNLPTIASKNFLITIADRSVTGLIARDQMIGPWQVPVADCAISLSDFEGYQGEAMAIGEKTPVSIINAAAAARMSVGEALTNLLGAYIEDISHINLSANWMCASGHPGEDAKLYQAVKSIGMELCPELGLTIPVGKDSMSMKSSWSEDGKEKSVTAPLSLIISAFSKTPDVRLQVTPLLETEIKSELFLIDLGLGKNRMGGSSLAQVFNQIGNIAPDLDDPKFFSKFFKLINTLNKDNLIIAYHDRSDGGALISLLEMAFASKCGLDIQSSNLITDLFNEELGCIIQVSESNRKRVLEEFNAIGLEDYVNPIAKINQSDEILIYQKNKKVFQDKRSNLQKLWSSTSFEIAKLRDNPDCAESENFETLKKSHGLKVSTVFDINEEVSAPYLNQNIKPKIAILREQGINGHVEMAAAFSKASFEATDVHMSQILSGEISLSQFKGLAACGGFSYGDVLGAGRGWANSILLNKNVKDEFSEYFLRTDSFTLGVCNGCQMISNLSEIIPGTEEWPSFEKNTSEQFEARFTGVKIIKSKSIFFKEMHGSIMPIAIAHGEGKAVFGSNLTPKNIAMQYVDHSGSTSQVYPHNPNGSENSAAAICDKSGRITIMMPHPERVFRTVQNSWHPNDWQERSPWLRMFENAREWIK